MYVPWSDAFTTSSSCALRVLRDIPVVLLTVKSQFFSSLRYGKGEQKQTMIAFGVRGVCWMGTLWAGSIFE